MTHLTFLNSFAVLTNWATTGMMSRLRRGLARTRRRQGFQLPVNWPVCVAAKNYSGAVLLVAVLTYRTIREAVTVRIWMPGVATLPVLVDAANSSHEGNLIWDQARTQDKLA
jgi:hypothetical protein